MNGRSTSGYCIFIIGNLISWKNKKQDVVVRSSVEAKYRVMALATCELIRLKHLLQEIMFGNDSNFGFGARFYLWISYREGDGVGK